jgi:tRNA pseudouridine38-40 synthase
MLFGGGARHGMRIVKLIIQFEGTRYHGWQFQPRQLTVQQVITDALARILGERVTVHGSGRTDAGVHALGQVAHIQTVSTLSPIGIMKGLNSMLPPDIAIVGAEDMPAGFHARFSAVRRVYWYAIWNSPVRSAFCSRYAWHIIRPLDLSAMRRAADHLVGTHDFSAFQAVDRVAVSTVREVFAARIRRSWRHVVLFDIQANAFLKRMVRSLVGSLVEVGRGTISPDAFKEILESRDRAQAGPTAPACGLFLRKVVY